MKAYKNKLKRDVIASITVKGGVFGVYINAVQDYEKGDEVFLGVIKESDKELFDKFVKKIK